LVFAVIVNGIGAGAHRG